MRRTYAREMNRAKSAWEENQQTTLEGLMKHLKQWWKELKKLKVVDERGTRNDVLKVKDWKVLMRAVRSLYDNGKACVSVQGQKSDWFGVGQGVRQGCTMSLWLFNIFMDNIVREAKQRFDGGVEMETGTIQVQYSFCEGVRWMKAAETFEPKSFSG